MTKLLIKENQYNCQPQETVLEALLKADVNAPFGCKKGNCHSCMLRSLDVVPPIKSQVGIKDTLKQQNYFLACCCVPEQDMSIKLPDQADLFTDGKIVVHKMLNHNTVLLGIKLKEDFVYKAGQFVNLQRPDGLTRSYSIANCSYNSKPGMVEFHIRILPNGRFSDWIHKLKVGNTLAVSEAHGHCFYLPNNKTQALLLVGTGTGLSPLVGILSDALAQGHSGPIHLFHGASTVEDLYKVAEMQQLSKENSNFYYTPCVSGTDNIKLGFSSGRANEVAINTILDLIGWRVFLCGHPYMVTQMQTDALLKGAKTTDVYADAFHLATDGFTKK